MHAIDWIIMLLPVIGCSCLAIFVKRYLKDVTDYMTGGRRAGRYLIMTARSEQGSGAAGYVSFFQAFAVSGFTLHWWSLFVIPVQLVVAITGFVIYRYRETKAMTLAEFFEMRYSRQFRIFAGLLGFIAGLINFGVIPALGARFMVYFLGLPQYIPIGDFQIATFLVLMAVFLSISVTVTTLGGQMTVMVTDCAEGMISQIFYFIIAIVLLVFVFSWVDSQAMLLDAKPGHSMVNPFDSAGQADFNLAYMVIALWMSIYGTMAWQNNHAFNSSAFSPHESRMGVILGRWRHFAISTMMIILGVCALTFLHSDAGAAAVQAQIQAIGDSDVSKQVAVPVALSHVLPIGIKGMLLAVVLMGIVAGDGIHLHSWSSIFVQDVLVPLRKKPVTPAENIRYLRWSVVGVALFAFIFGAMFPLIEYVSLWFLVTMSIFIGGAGAVIIGGLYWSRGTTAGAWAALIIGSVIPLSGIAIRIYYNKVLHQDFPFNPTEIGFAASIAALVGYVVVSLVTCRKPHDMNKLLNRDPAALAAAVAARPKRSLWNRIEAAVGIDENFSRGDKIITYGITGWSLLWFLIFIVGCVVQIWFPIADKTWANYWLVVGILLPLLISLVTTVWFTIGGLSDMRAFFSSLRRGQQADSGGSRLPEREA